jgi:hypothetical protein
MPRRFSAHFLFVESTIDASEIALQIRAETMPEPKQPIIGTIITTFGVPPDS